MNFSDIKYPTVTPESVKENLANISEVPINGRLLHKFVPAGNYGIAIGDDVFQNVTSVNQQIAIGYKVFPSLTGNNFATMGVGGSIGPFVTTSNESVYVGHYQLNRATTSSYSVGIGLYNGMFIRAGGTNWGNTMLGYDAGEGFGSGARNVYLGMNCGSSNWHNDYDNNDCILIGSYNELYNAAKSVSNSMLFGNYMANFEAENNTIYMGRNDQTFVLQKGAVIGELITTNLGTDRLRVVGDSTTTGTSKNFKLKVGVCSWNSTTSLMTDYEGHLVAGGQHTSTYFGMGALKNGDPNYYFQNSAFGFAALRNGGGGNNDAFGGWALANLSSGSENSAFGRDAMGSLQNASGNVAVGLTAGYNLTTGNGNVFVGRRTGWGLQTGSSNIIIGDYIQGLPAALTNTTIIGGTETRDNVVKIGRSNQLFSLGKVPTEYADNAAALAAGLLAGDIYRTGEILKVVF